MEQLERVDNPDEKDMDRYLKAHDDLQTVLRVYEGVMDSKTALPLQRSGLAGAGAGAGARSTGAEISDDDSLQGGEGAGGEGGEGGGRRKKRTGGGRRRAREGSAASRARAVEGAQAGTSSSGRASPAKGNLLDLEENAPLEMGMAGAGTGNMTVAYTDGRFSANHGGAGGGGGGAGGASSTAGYDSSSSAAQGSTTASNFPSETGAVYGSNTFASSNGGSNLSAQAGVQSGAGDSAAGFGESTVFLFCGGRVSAAAGS